MSTHQALLAHDNIYWVGALDPDIRIFDIIMWTDYGTTYNAYCVKAEKTVLFEAVKEPFFDEYYERLSGVCDVSNIDYIVLNHTEPDHSGSLKRLLELSPDMTVVASPSGINILKDILNQPFKSRAVTEKDEIDIGGMTLKFLSVPMLHWPDSMFTYIPEAKALFTCDAFGCHYSDEQVFNDLIKGDFYDAYKYYFDNIMGPYKNPHMLKALDKIKDLDIEFVGNGHGPVLRKDIQKYFDLYRQWSQPQTPSKPSIAICYASAYGYTGQLAEQIAEGIKDAGIPDVTLYDLVTGDKTAAKAAIAQSTGFLLGSATLVGDALPPVYEMLIGLNPIIHKGKYAGAFGSFAWSGEAVRNLLTRMQQLKLNIPLEGLTVKLKPSQEQLEEAHQYGVDFANAILTGENFAPQMSAADSKDVEQESFQWKCLVCAQVFEGEQPPAVCPVCGAPAEQFEKVKREEASFQSSSQEHYVLIGGGAAALEAAKSIRLRNKAARITLISTEAVLPYNRPALSDVVAKEATFDALFIESLAWYEQNGIALMLDDTADSIDTATGAVHTVSGQTIPYDKLLLATGSTPFVPVKDALSQPNTYVLRTIDDADALLQAAQESESALVVGGGILGLEAADALLANGLSVTIVEFAPCLMGVQLDAFASELLRQKVLAAGMDIYTGCSVTAVQDGVVTLSNGKELKPDFIVFSCGTRANIQLATDAGIACNRGILVDSMMATSVDGIYAAGDCAEMQGSIVALWSSAVEQGKVAGANMAGDMQILAHNIPATVFEGMGVKIFSAGLIREDETTTAMIYKNDQRDIYKKLVFKNGRLMGGLLYNDTDKSLNLLRMVEHKTTVGEASELLR
ncbi:MAG: FAD-dependent oxidoreductase [Christensenellales bacterium]